MKLSLSPSKGSSLYGRALYDRITPTTIAFANSGKTTKMEQSFIALKPDAVQRGLIGPVIQRFEQRGFKLVGLKLMQVSRDLAEKHYEAHSSKPFFKGLVDFLVSAPIVAMVWEGNGIIDTARKMMGATNPLNAEPGTIRGDFSVDIGRNVIHGSDSPENAKREINLFFKPEELSSSWKRSNDSWFYENMPEPVGSAK
jgi:nucleoside-diphosphate kinase